MPRKRRKVRLVVVPASHLGWEPRSDWFLLDKHEAHGPFPTQEAALAAAQRKPGMFGYGPCPNLGHMS